MCDKDSPSLTVSSFTLRIVPVWITVTWLSLPDIRAEWKGPPRRDFSGLEPDVCGVAWLGLDAGLCHG